MTDRIKRALDSIHAEDTLKTTTTKSLHEEIQRRSSKHSPVLSGRFSAALCSLAILLFSGGLLYYLNFTPNAYIDMDVNPSVEITLNHFDRVIDTYAYNTDGERILEETDIKYKNYEEAVSILLDTIVQNGYTLEDGLISITIQSNNGKKESLMLSHIEATAQSHHGTAQIECFSIGGHLRDTAHHLNLSPAKYLAIQDLIRADPTATVEGCREHSISELKALTQEHAGRHLHGGASDGSTDSGQGKGHHASQHHQEQH